MRTSLLALITLLSLALNSPANEAADLIAKGDAYDQSYEPDKALEYYLPAEKLAPTNADLMVKIARQFVYKMDTLPSNAAKAEAAKTSLQYAERAVDLDPSSSDAHLSVAICLGKYVTTQGNREKVEGSKRIKDASEKAVALNPKNDLAWHLLGRWHQSLSEMGGLTRGVASLVYGGLPDASFEDSIRCFEKGIELAPNRLIHYIELGRTYAAMGETAEAERLIKKGLAMPNRDQGDPGTKERGRKTLSELN